MIYEIEHTVMIEYVEQNGNRSILQKGEIFLKQGYDAPIYSHWYDKLQEVYLKACCFGLKAAVVMI